MRQKSRLTRAGFWSRDYALIYSLNFEMKALVNPKVPAVP
jgi:hypothetical protein